jgi:2-dehydro-3-deoxyglucarate aldolase/4-hydroxy-2-oxoheptanedioate aldolase
MKAFLGTWLSIGSPVIAELAALSGFEWVLLDLEHGNTSGGLIPDQLRALRGTRTKGIVRAAALRPEDIARFLDWGADGIMLPHVSDQSEAEAFVCAAYYPPRGKRGFSRTVRAHGYGLYAPEEKAPPLLLAQIETFAAVEAASRIARVEGIDALFVGPADLQHDLRQRQAVLPAAFEECLERVADAARAAGKCAGLLVRDPSEVQVRLAQGFTHLAVQSDLSLLRESYGAILRGARQSEA